jgi:hypothetical protein
MLQTSQVHVPRMQAAAAALLWRRGSATEASLVWQFLATQRNRFCPLIINQHNNNNTDSKLLYTVNFLRK